MTTINMVIAVIGSMAASLAVAGAAFYKVSRILREDKITDNLHKNSIDLIADYRVKALDSQAELNRVREKLEVTEKERSHFASEVGKLTATIEYMTERISSLEIMCEKLEAENRKLLDQSTAQSAVLEQVLVELQRRSTDV